MGIVLLAFMLRALYLLQAREHLFFNQGSDSLYYHRWAESIVGGSADSSVFFMGPLYPYLLALFYRIFGPGHDVVLWFQTLLGSASCGLIYLLGRMTFGRTVGLLAALMGALYGVAIFYGGLLLMTTTLYAINLLVLISILWALRGKKWYLWIIPGLLLGLSSLGRASLLAFLPLLALGIFLLARDRGSKFLPRLRAVLALLLGLFLVLAPVVVRNFLVAHDLVLITSNLGLNFYVGNNPEARGDYQRPAGLVLSIDRSGSEIAEVLVGRKLKPSEVSRFWLQEALVFINKQPGAFLRLTLDKLLLFWNAYEIPQVEHFDFFKKFAPVLKWPLLTFSLLGPFGLLGMILSLGRWRESYFPLTFIVSMMAAIVLFFVISRLRFQICSVLMVFAAYALVWLWERLRSRKIRQMIAAIVALIPLILLVNRPHPALSASRDMANSHNFLAEYLWKVSGDLQGALREYQQAVAVDPNLAATYLNLANLRLEQGRAGETLDLWDKALRLNPQLSAVHLNLGNVYAKQKMWPQAIEEFRAAVEVGPYNVLAHLSLSRAIDGEEFSFSPSAARHSEALFKALQEREKQKSAESFQ